jgi:hypothetical protein
MLGLLQLLVPQAGTIVFIVRQCKWHKVTGQQLAVAFVSSQQFNLT